MGVTSFGTTKNNILILMYEILFIIKVTSTVHSRSVYINAEVNSCIVKASSAFGRLRMAVWESRGISQCIKIKFYKAVILTILLYCCKEIQKTPAVSSLMSSQHPQYPLRCSREHNYAQVTSLEWQTPESQNYYPISY